jgi:hypothetical protein
MATLSQLVSTLANVMGLPEATVFAYGRFAREAGYISQAGRGRGGAQMTAVDAANLIIALSGTSVTREAGKAIETFMALQGWLKFPTERLLEPIERWIDKYRCVTKQNDEYFMFGPFMDFLIAESASGDLEWMLRSIPVYDVPRRPDPDWGRTWMHYADGTTPPSYRLPEQVDIIEDILMEIKLTTNSPAASFVLGVRGVFDNKILNIYFGDEDEDIFETSKKNGDLCIEYCISQQTILAAGRCIDEREI